MAFSHNTTSFFETQAFALTSPVFSRLGRNRLPTLRCTSLASCGLIELRLALRFFIGLVLGVVLAGLGPSVAVMLASRDTIELVTSDRFKGIFIALMLMPLLVFSAVPLVRMVWPMKVGEVTAWGANTGAAIVLSAEVLMILCRILF